MNIDIDKRIENKKRALRIKMQKINNELEQLDDAHFYAGLPLNYGIKIPSLKKKKEELRIYA